MAELLGVGSGFPLRAVPDEGVSPFLLARPQGRGDRGIEARVVQLDRDVFLAVVGGRLPAFAELDAVARGDAKVLAIARNALDGV